MAESTNDTDPEARAVLDSRLASMTPEQKLQRVSELALAVTELSLAGLRMRHPGESEGALLLRLARMRLGDALFDAVYPQVGLRSGT